MINEYFVDKALEDAKVSLEEVQEHMKAWEAQFTSTDKKLRAERATSSTLKVHAYIFTFVAQVPHGT